VALRRRNPLEVYITCVIGLAAAMAIITIAAEITDGDRSARWPPIALCVVLLGIGESRTWFRFGDGAEVTPGWTFAFSIVLLGSPSVAMVAIAGSTLLVDLVGRRGWQKSMFNVAQVVVSLTAGALLLRPFGVIGPLTANGSITLEAAIGVMVAATVVFVTNGLLTCIVLAMYHRTSLRSMIGRDFVQSVSADGALLALSPIFVVVIDDSVLLLPLLGVTAFLVYRSSQQALQRAHEANHDPLTRLLNRRAFTNHIEGFLGSHDEQTPRGAIVLLDLDGFKQVNDTFGHAHGDELLCQVAERLSRCLRQHDEVSRIGGDEFVLVLDGEQDAAAISSRVLATLRTAVPVAGISVSVRASLGIALTRDAASPDELLRNADLAMYASKASGRDRVTWYEPWMHESARRRMSLHHGLRTALAEGHLALHYQPIVRLPDGAIVGAEALLRWEHPLEGPIAPDVFIPVAEESGIIADIDVWVLEQACLDVAAWRARGLSVPPVSINVSRRHMTLELPDLLQAALSRHGLPGSALCIEVTESAVVPDAEVASLALTRVRELGVTVALDDFGSGQSSLSQLARLPVDSVKIDRSFTCPTADPAALRLLTSIVRVCQALSLPIVAEGIEQAELAEFLAEIGCDRGQGFHFGRPQSARRFRTLLGPVHLPTSRTGAHDAPSRISRPR
jgi:diguanylate cyclase (GGDEF)-like protein